MIVFVLILFIACLIWIEVRLWIINVHLRQKLVNIQTQLQSIFVQLNDIRRLIKREDKKEDKPLETLKFLFI